MNLEGIKKIEEELKIRLPESYKNVVLNNPYGDELKYDIISKHFYDDPDKLIKINKRLRKQGLQKREWLDNLFAIAYYDSDYTFIRIDEGKESIYIADRGTYKYNPSNLKDNLFKESYEAYLATFVVLQQMKNNS